MAKQPSILGELGYLRAGPFFTLRVERFLDGIVPLNDTGCGAPEMAQLNCGINQWVRRWWFRQRKGFGLAMICLASSRPLAASTGVLKYDTALCGNGLYAEAPSSGGTTKMRSPRALQSATCA